MATALVSDLSGDFIPEGTGCNVVIEYHDGGGKREFDLTTEEGNELANRHHARGTRRRGRKKKKTEPTTDAYLEPDRNLVPA